MTSLNLNDTLRYFKNVIIEACNRTWHYERPANEDFPFAVWTEYTEENALHANNQKKSQPVTIMLHYFTQTEFDETIDAIQNTLNAAPGISFELTDIQFEEDTHVIHYSWNVEVLYGEGNCCRIR